MNVYELKDLLGRQPESTLRFTLPTDDALPAHFHLTEVGRVEKSFIDCGGTKRSNVSCQLQLWTAEDFEHCLYAEKMLRILNLSAEILKSDELPIEVEYGSDVTSIYMIGDVVSAFGSIKISLLGKQTDCLAKEKCGVGGCSDTQGCC
ncbi:MAG TPA: DUF6428 family protein [Pirellula sp.]|nr:DUF6428 family protein [Pirellula sp.]